VQAQQLQAFKFQVLYAAMIVSQPKLSPYQRLVTSVTQLVGRPHEIEPHPEKTSEQLYSASGLSNKYCLPKVAISKPFWLNHKDMLDSAPQCCLEELLDNT